MTASVTAVGDLGARIDAYAAALAIRDVDVRALAALGRFLASFERVRPAVFFAAAEQTISGPPLPEDETAVLAAEAATELTALAPLLEAWKAPKSTVVTTEKLAALLQEHPDWSLRSIEILVTEQLKRAIEARPSDAA